jgi:hypothetical protein
LNEGPDTAPLIQWIGLSHGSGAIDSFALGKMRPVFLKGCGLQQVPEYQPSNSRYGGIFHSGLENPHADSYWQVRDKMLAEILRGERAILQCVLAKHPDEIMNCIWER